VIREHVPWRLRAPVRRARNAVAAARLIARQRARWRAIAETSSRRDALAVSYGSERMPGPDETVFGGAVKFQLMHRSLPNAPRDFNVLYLGSSSLPIDARMLLRLARRRGAVFAWNQNGVAYRGWYGDGWELVNAPRARLLHEADWVVFQSTFCKVASDRFYGPRADRFEVLHNPVDVVTFSPVADKTRRPLTILLGGNQYQRYRVESALAALAAVRREQPDAQLLVAGDLSFAPDAPAQTAAMIGVLGLDDAVELTGTYTQADAPALFHRADILLHPKYNDPCPTVVIEAMACGLPVVYSASGGTPELVGPEAGAGIEAPLDWEHDHPPAAGALAHAILTIAAELPDRAAAARERSLRFDAREWVERHRRRFAELAEARAILGR
jgi:glycosyltransferase involved in cell wall biosynthesis